MCNVPRWEIYATDLPKSDGPTVGSKFKIIEKLCDKEVKALERTALKQLTRNFNWERFIAGMRFVEKGPVDGDIVILRWLNGSSLSCL